MGKTLIALLAMAAVLAAGTTSAQEAKAPAQTPKASQPAMGMDTKTQMGRMDEQITRMQTLHDRLASARTPAERQKVMEDERVTLQEGMGMMSQMMQGGGMMGGGGTGGGMMGGGGTGSGMTGQQAVPADANAQIQLMAKRMDMMQMMMQMMMDQQGMSGAPKGSGAAPKK